METHMHEFVFYQEEFFDKKGYRELEYDRALSNTLTQDIMRSLSKEFGNKIPSWIKKMFNEFMKIFLRNKLKNKRDIEAQTQEEV